MAATSRATERGPINLAARMGSWSARHRKTAIFGWLAFVGIAFVLGGLVGTKSLGDAAAQPGEAGRAAKLYVAGGLDRGDPESVLVQSRTLSASDPAFRSTVRDLHRTLAREPGISDLRSPYEGKGERVSKDGHSALIQFRLGATRKPSASIERILAAVEGVARAHPALYVGEYGDASATKALDDSVGRDFHRAELFSIPLTLAILLVAFGAFVAAGIPLLLALTAVLAAIGLLALPSQIWPADDAANSVILLIGLAVGVDYSLFYIRREREERALGKGREAALEAAAAPSGRAVLLSGITVLIAMAGMFLTGEKELASVGVGAMLVVATAVAGSLTVLPALLAWLGDRIEKGRIPLLGGRRGESRFFGAVVDRVVRRPLLWVALAGGLLVALALPAFALHTNNAGLTALPQNLTIAKTYERIQNAFPGGPQPAYVVVKAANVGAAPVRHAAAELRRRAGRGHASGDPPRREPVPERDEPRDVLAHREHARRLVGGVRELVVRLQMLGHVHDAAAVDPGEEADAPAPQRVDQDRVPALRLSEDAGLVPSLSF